MRVILFLCTLLIARVHSLPDYCASQLTCQECIQRPLCGWCLNKYIPTNRCFNIQRPRTAGTYYCWPDFVFYPENKIILSKDEQASKSTDNSIRPQAILLELVIGVPQEVSIFYSVGEDFKGSSVSLSHTQGDKIGVSYRTQCTGNKPLLSNTCNKVMPGQQIEFIVQFELKECPKKRADWETSVQFTSPQLKSSVAVNITMICSCSCDEPGSPHYIENADECNGGTSKCGTCYCNRDTFGKNCECSTRSNLFFMEDNCKPQLGKHGLECSGLGYCKCNGCICDGSSNPAEIVYGKHCECDNFSCLRYGGLLCNEKGRCDCGKCVCEPSWSGEGCELNTP